MPRWAKLIIIFPLAVLAADALLIVAMLLLAALLQ